MWCLGGQFSKIQPKYHNFNLFSHWTSIHGSIVKLVPDNLCNINCYVSKLYKVYWLIEIGYLFGLVFFVKTANLGCFCNTQSNFGERPGQLKLLRYKFNIIWSKISMHFFLAFKAFLFFSQEDTIGTYNVIQCSDFLILPGSYSSNYCVNFWSCWLILFSKLKLKCIFFI